MYAATLPQPLTTEAQRLRLARVTLGASRQCVYKRQLPSQRLSSSLFSLVSSISAIYKADYSCTLYVPSQHQIHSKRERLSSIYKIYLLSSYLYFIKGLGEAYAFIVFLFATLIPKSSARVTYSKCHGSVASHATTHVFNLNRSLGRSLNGLTQGLFGSS
jgi:hypothetical protein